MRIAIVGASGQLGTALQACLQGEIVPLTHAEIEITDAARVDAALSAAKPDCVINAAAYNFVDRAEDEPKVTHDVNALGPSNLARWCERSRASLVHVSTDYVFGSDATRTTPYAESDPLGPQSVYAASKAAGERFVQNELTRHFIVRTCGLYGSAATQGKVNFVKTMLRLAKERKELSVVNDQHCTPSFASDIAVAIARLIAGAVRPLPRDELRRHNLVRIRLRDLSPREHRNHREADHVGRVSAEGQTARLQRA